MGPNGDGRRGGVGRGSWQWCSFLVSDRHVRYRMSLVGCLLKDLVTAVN